MKFIPLQNVDCCKKEVEAAEREANLNQQVKQLQEACFYLFLVNYIQNITLFPHLHFNIVHKNWVQHIFPMPLPECLIIIIFSIAFLCSLFDINLHRKRNT